MRHLNLAGYAAIPLAFLVKFLGHKYHWSFEPVLTFTLAALGVIPLAGLMGHSTEHLAERTGPTWGGLLNATFGNAAELIIAIIALFQGLDEIVKASLTGSILGNLLLVGGAAMLAGGWKRERQHFNAQAAEANAGLLALAVAGMLFPAIFHFTAEQAGDKQIAQHEEAVSIGTSIILLLAYVAGLIFTLRTHAHVFTRAPSESPEQKPGVDAINQQGWSVKKCVVMLLVASAGVAIVAHLLVESADVMAQRLGWSPIFVGVILLAIIGNAAEHSTAVLLARRDDMDTAMTITYQSSLQIALFATPALVLLSWVFSAAGWAPSPPMNMVFTPMEVVSVVLAVGAVVVLGSNGQTNWFEGVLLLALYAILGVAFFYMPTGGHAR